MARLSIAEWNFWPLVSYRGGTGVMMKYMGSDDGLILIWGYNQEKKTFNPWRLYHTDKTGTREIYWYDGKSKRFRLHSIQRQLHFQVGFKKYHAKALIPVFINGPRTVVAFASGEAFAVTVNQKFILGVRQIHWQIHCGTNRLRDLETVKTPMETVWEHPPRLYGPKGMDRITAGYIRFRLSLMTTRVQNVKAAYWFVCLMISA